MTIGGLGRLDQSSRFRNTGVQAESSLPKGATKPSRNRLRISARVGKVIIRSDLH